MGHALLLGVVNLLLLLLLLYLLMGHTDWQVVIRKGLSPP